MVGLECDDPVMEQALRAHAEILAAQGGSVAPGVVIRSERGEISIAHPGSLPHDTPLITVPDASLIRIVPDILRLEGDDIVLGPAASGRTVGQRHILEAQCNVFNIGRKIAKLRNRLPGFTHRVAPALLATLRERRIPAGGAAADKSCIPAPPDPLEAFLATRLLNWRESERPDARSSVLMSLIDYFDHHADGARYDALPEPARLSVQAARRAEPSDICHVNYNAGDAHAMFLNHGFVDESATHARTAQFDIEIEGIGALQVKPGRQRETLPHSSDREGERQFPTPSVRSLAPDLIEVSNLVIKRTDGRSALRRGIAIAVLPWLKGFEQLRANRIVDRVEAQVLEKTRAYYSDLRHLAEQHSGKIDPGPIHRLANLQDAILLRYVDGA